MTETVLLMALAGGLGAVCRAQLDGWVKMHSSAPTPLGTWTVNLLGSLLLGSLTALWLRGGLGDDLRLVLGSGFCGGFTTFSTACVEAVRLVREGRPWWGLLHLAGGSLACVLVAVLGFSLLA